ncbi:MAG: cation transporter [Clostridia bacterium]|nr:cation transporter [Clostridia bacterium]
MTDIILKRIIKDGENAKTPRVRIVCGIVVSIIGIILNLLLAAFKLLAGMISGSISITADAVNNLSDAGAQGVSLVSFKMASKPADREHPFGHARIEYVASMIASFLILMVGVELFRESIRKIFDPAEISFGVLPSVILACSILVKIFLSLLNRSMGKKIDSSVMRATATDSISDAAATLAVLVSSVIGHFTGINTDAYMGVAVACFIFIAGIRILNETKNSILGTAPDADTVEAIKSTVKEYPEIQGIHDMVIHNYGAGNTIASLHAEVDGRSNIFEIHDVIDNIEKRLYDECGVRATIHMDPIVTDDETVARLKSFVAVTVKDLDERLCIHDFRCVEGKTHTNLIFDISVPFELKMKDSEIIDSVQKKINEKNPEFFGVITIDRE